MHHRSRRQRIAAKSETVAAPTYSRELINDREPRYKADGTMYAQDIELGFLQAGWPGKLEG